MDKYEYEEMLEKKLFAAVKNENLEEVKEAIEQGVNIEAWSNRALRDASRYGNLEIVKHLVDNGAYIYAKGNEPFYEAVHSGHLPVVQYFIEKGVSVNKEICTNFMPLELAARDGQLEIVKYFVENHADNMNHQYHPAFIMANRMGRLEVVQYLAEEAGLDIHTNESQPLREAAKNAHYDLCEYLIGKGADPQKVYDDVEHIKEHNRECVASVVNKIKFNNALSEKPITKAQQLSNDIESEDFTYKPSTTRTARTKL